MSAKIEDFIVVSVGNTGGYGYDEHALPVLVALSDHASVDYSRVTQTGVVMFFRSSKKRLDGVRQIVAEAERLRDCDARFIDLKIGVADGTLVCEFDWLGRVKKNGVGPMGDAAVAAVRGEGESGAYRQKLNLLAAVLAKKRPNQDHSQRR